MKEINYRKYKESLRLKKAGHGKRADKPFLDIKVKKAKSLAVKRYFEDKNKPASLNVSGEFFKMSERKPIEESFEKPIHEKIGVNYDLIKMATWSRRKYDRAYEVTDARYLIVRHGGKKATATFKDFTKAYLYWKDIDEGKVRKKGIWHGQVIGY